MIILTCRVSKINYVEFHSEVRQIRKISITYKVILRDRSSS